MVDLTRFTLQDMTALGSVLRHTGAGASSMEEVASRVVRRLHESLVDGETGEPCCALARFFKTHDYGALEAPLQTFARAMLKGEAPAARTKCLTLLATAGDQPAWNERQQSAAHQAIPLASEAIVRGAPMISSLLRELGVEVGQLVVPQAVILVDHEPSSFNVFYVADARGSSHIPAQQDFVKPAGIRSVLGFGGRLPRGDIFAVILFLKTSIAREVAEQFRTLALSLKLAVLPFDEAVFASQRDAPYLSSDPRAAEMRRLEARVTTLEELFQVYEGSVIEQSDKLASEQEAMRFQKTLLECQGEASIDGILSVSTDGRILFANRRLAEMWGVQPPVPGRHCYQDVLLRLSEQTDDPSTFLETSAALEGPEPGRGEVSLRDGRTFDRYTAPIRGADGQFLGRVWHFRDISATQELGRMKNEFIASVSHELRTPLTSIQGALDLMLSGVTGDVPDEALALAKIAKQNCARAVRLVNDVLDIERIEAGRMEFRLEPLLLESLVVQAVEAVRSYGDPLGITFEVHSAIPEARVLVDADRLIQVLGNLLSNAAKFSPEGSSVVVSLSRNAGLLRISVADQGPGIPEEFHRHVFEKFAQGPPTDARREGGTGLGLHIALAIVERLEGRMEFESTPGRGTIFHVDLPEWSPDCNGDEGRAE